MTEHYCHVLVLCDFAQCFTATKNNKLEKEIRFKRGSGYHAIIIHAERLNSYSLLNQMLLYEMQ